MKCRFAFLALVLAFTPSLRADDKPKPSTEKPKTPTEQYKALLAEQQKAQEEFEKAYREAKTDDERNKAFREKYPQGEKYAGRMLKIAEGDPKDTAALDALVWIMQNAGYGAEANKAIDLLLKDHIDNPKIDSVCGNLAYSDSASAEKFLRTAMEKSPHRSVQGQAAYALGRFLQRRSQRHRGLGFNPFAKQADPKTAAAEAEKLFEQVAEKYGDLPHYRGSLAKAAQGDLFEIRNLVIGKVAPDIEGEDIDGKTFKLSDYRGKVVVIDFWGHW